MIRLWSICKNTFAQTTRQPIYGVLILVTFAILILSFTLSGWTLGANYHESDQRMFEGIGLSTLLLSGLLIAAFSASSVLAREIDDKTALTVISKPVSRPTFVLGKYIGVAAAVALAFYICSIVYLMAVRHRVLSAVSDPYDWPVIILGLSAFVTAMVVALLGNYFFGWPFVSAALWCNVLLLSMAMGAISFIGKKWQIVPLGYDTPTEAVIHGQLLLGTALIFMAVMIFVAVAVAASTRLGQVMTLGVCFSVFFAGSAHAWLIGHWQADYPIVGILGWALPKMTYFYPLDALTNDRVTIPLDYVGNVAIYCAVYTAAVLAVGMALFQRRQLESQTSSSTMPGAVAMLAWTGRIASLAAWIAVAIIVTLPKYYTVPAMAVAVGIATAAGLNWALWSVFGRGAKWAYWLVTTLAVLALIGMGVMALAPGLMADYVGSLPRAAVAITTIAVMLLVVILVLPGTRRHFKSTV